MERAEILASQVKAHAAEAAALRTIAAAIRQRLEAVTQLASLFSMEADALGDLPEAQLTRQHATIAAKEIRTLETEVAHYEAEAKRADSQSHSAQVKRVALEQSERLGFVHT
jgi:hypothetical protein